MWVQDEIKDYTRYESLSFVDFLEALARAADRKALPNRYELERNGFHDIMDWYRGRDGVTEEPELSGQEEDIPLSAKLDVFLDLVFRMLHDDPAQPDSEFSHEALLKMVKRKDKELGP